MKTLLNKIKIIDYPWHNSKRIYFIFNKILFTCLSHFSVLYFSFLLVGDAHSEKWDQLVLRLLFSKICVIFHSVTAKFKKGTWYIWKWFQLIYWSRWHWRVFHRFGQMIMCYLVFCFFKKLIFTTISTTSFYSKDNIWRTLFRQK